MKLPHIDLPRVYHVGSMNLSGTRVLPRTRKNWDFEAGLLPVSLDPIYWLARRSMPAPTVYEIQNTTPLRLIDADLVAAQFSAQVIAAAQKKGLLHGQDLSPRAYNFLGLNHGSFQSHGIPFQLETTCVALLAMHDPQVHGLWYSNVTNGISTAPRGGIFLHVLPKLQTVALKSASFKTYWRKTEDVL